MKLKGPPLTRATVAFLEFAPDQAVAHVDGGPSGQVILSWDGKKLHEVSKIGKVRDDERHWFVVEDLDGDGVSEIIRYFGRDISNQPRHSNHHRLVVARHHVCYWPLVRRGAYLSR